MINCLYLIQSTISLYEFTERQLEILESQIQTNLGTVIAEQTTHFLGTVGLSDFHSALKQGKPSEEHFKALEGCSEQLTALTLAPDQYQLSQCRLLTSSRLREEAHQRAIVGFREAYEAVYAAICTEKRLETVVDVLQYSPEQLEQLLS